MHIQKPGRKANQQEKTKPDRLWQTKRLYVPFIGGNIIHGQLNFYLHGTIGSKAKIQILKKQTIIWIFWCYRLNFKCQKFIPILLEDTVLSKQNTQGKIQLLGHRFVISALFYSLCSKFLTYLKNFRMINLAF